MATIYDFFYQLQSSGFYEFALPFLLVFTIVFAILEKTKLFGTEAKTGEPRKNINVVIALIIGLIVVNQFEIVGKLNLFLPKVSLFIIVSVMFLILIGIFGAKVDTGFSGILLLLFAIASLFVIYWALIPGTGTDIFGGGGSDIGFWLENNAGTLLFLVIIGIIIWAVVGGGGQGGVKKFEEDFIDRWFGRKP